MALAGVIAVVVASVAVLLVVLLVSVRSVVLEQADAVARACSLDRAALRSRMDSGMTLEEVAAEHGVDAERVVADSMRTSRHRWLRWLSRRTNWGALGL